eukprot:m.209921 g.209921  ORF g.209921 m.209921 type:complete len:111 (+) comp15048_c0_seq28:895-1227(+)
MPCSCTKSKALMHGYRYKARHLSMQVRIYASNVTLSEALLLHESYNVGSGGLSEPSHEALCELVTHCFASMNSDDFGSCSYLTGTGKGSTSSSSLSASFISLHVCRTNLV